MKEEEAEASLTEPAFNRAAVRFNSLVYSSRFVVAENSELERHDAALAGNKPKELALGKEAGRSAGMGDGVWSGR
jgi:hypothetical protein